MELELFRPRDHCGWNFYEPGICPSQDGGFLITSITGTRNGTLITGLQPAGTAIPGNEPFAVDNLVFNSPDPKLTVDGFGFATADGNFEIPSTLICILQGYLNFSRLHRSRTTAREQVTLRSHPFQCNTGSGAHSSISHRRSTCSGSFRASRAEASQSEVSACSREFSITALNRNTVAMRHVCR